MTAHAQIVCKGAGSNPGSLPLYNNPELNYVGEVVDMFIRDFNNHVYFLSSVLTSSFSIIIHLTIDINYIWLEFVDIKESVLSS